MSLVSSRGSEMVPSRFDGETGGPMTEALVAIGDFSRMTYLTVKALRHYQDVGILEPWSIDEASGYRSYHVSQVPMAQVIRRLRDLDMPLEDVRTVVEAPDVDARNRAISEHLKRMEEQLGQTRDTIKSLRSLLEVPRAAREVTVRAMPAQWTLAIRETLPMAEASAWAEDAYTDLYEALDRLGGVRAGVDGALFYEDFFHKDKGDVVAFIPVEREVVITGIATRRVASLEIPAADLAVMIHEGSGATVDETYAELGAFVAQKAIGVAGPIQEHFTVTSADTDVVADHRTVVGWPIFRTQSA
jgi:DNA-binding transcriptional MerR regulator